MKKLRILIGILLTGAVLCPAQVLSLDDACRIALRENYGILANEADNSAREWQKRNAIAGYMPQVNYNATLLRMDDKTVDKANMSINMLPPNLGIDVEKLKTRKTTLSHEISVSQPIINGGAEIVAIGMANHTRAAQTAGYAADRQDLVQTVTKQYFDLLKAKEQCAIITADIAWTQRNLESAQIREAGGTIAKTDLLRWKQQLAEKEHTLTQMHALVALNGAMLAVSLGIQPEAARDWQMEPFTVFEQQFQSLTDLPAADISGNNRLKSLDSYRMLSKDNVHMTVAGGMPKLNGFVKYSQDQGFDNADKLYTKDGTWVGGLALNVPLFTGFRTTTSYKEARFDARKSDINFQQTKKQFETNLIRIREFYTASRLTAQSARELLTLTEENLAILTTRYEAGQISQLDLLDMQRAVTGTRIDYIGKVIEALNYHTEYQNAIGTLEESK